MTAKECVERLDWSSAIAAATMELDAISNQTGTTQQGGNKKQNNDAESYLYRGIARCFISEKEGKHKEAIEDLSKAIICGADNDTSYYYRAYAYYLDGDYERAIADCKNINTSTSNTYPYKDELFGKIYFAMGKYEEAAKNFVAVLEYCLKQTPPLSNPCLLDSYREACKKMNRV